MTLKNLNKPDELCTVKFTRRSWFSKEAFLFEGEVFRQNGKTKDVIYKLEGNWNDQVTIINT